MSAKTGYCKTRLDANSTRTVSCSNGFEVSTTRWVQVPNGQVFLWRPWAVYATPAPILCLSHPIPIETYSPIVTSKYLSLNQHCQISDGQVSVLKLCTESCIIPPFPSLWSQPHTSIWTVSPHRACSPRMSTPPKRISSAELMLCIAYKCVCVFMHVYVCVCMCMYVYVLLQTYVYI